MEIAWTLEIPWKDCREPQDALKYALRNTDIEQPQK